MTRTGADISHHQSSFNALTYKTSGEDFVILKATESDSFTDSVFGDRWRAARAVGLPRGAYAFARPGRAPVDRQADHFIGAVRAAGWQQGDAWALDLETNDGGLGPTQLVAWAERWCTRVRTALGGRGLFYSYLPFIKDTMGNPGRVPAGCLAWVARYRTDDPYAPPHGRPAGWPNPPDIWQCSNGEVGCVKSVASVGQCDYNHATEEAFAELFGTTQEGDLSMADAQDILAELAKLRQDMTVFGTTGLEQTVEAFATRQRQVLSRLEGIEGDLAEVKALLAGSEPPA